MRLSINHVLYFVLKVFVYYLNEPSFIFYFLKLFYISVLVFFILKSDSVICDSVFIWFYQSQVIINTETVLYL
jgi:hypothetical protein